MSRLVTVLVLAGAFASPAAAQLELADDGRTFVYRMQAGDSPLRAAARLGLDADEAAALLAEQGVRDATRVAPGFALRVPNPLADEVDRLRGEASDATRREAEATARADRLERETEALRENVAVGAEQRDRLALLERYWALATTTLIGMAIALVVSVAVTTAALRLRARAVAYADDLARDLEAKRALHLVERQRSGKELIALEERARELEGQLRIRAQAS
jgi:hypothetical protein